LPLPVLLAYGALEADMPLEEIYKKNSFFSEGFSTHDVSHFLVYGNSMDLPIFE